MGDNINTEGYHKIKSNNALQVLSIKKFLFLHQKHRKQSLNVNHYHINNGHNNGYSLVEFIVTWTNFGGRDMRTGEMAEQNRAT